MRRAPAGWDLTGAAVSSLRAIFAGCALFFAAATAPAAHPDLGYLVRGGHAASVVVIPADATPAEETAARELREHLRQISGAELPLVAEKDYSAARGPCVSIGRTKLSATQVDDTRLASFGDDGYAILSRGGNAFLLGGRRRGALYAVYEFLESLGVRWYSPDYTVIPHRPDVLMPAEPISVTPAFWYRDQWWNNGASPEWLARVRINGSNGQNHSLPIALGGSAITVHDCHSYKALVPAAEHFEKHREWFAVKEGGQRSSRLELCLTNPELRAYVAEKVLADLRARRGQVDLYWVSQNDGGRSGCFCDRCTAERTAHGGADRWAANTTAFASFVADRVRPEFPRVRVKTLAYSYTQAAPENMRTPDNLLVEVCGNFRGGADDPHRRLLDAWAKVVSNISVYTYGGSNYGYWWPYPNAEAVGRQSAWAREAGVSAFYIQGTALGRGSGLVDLKAYVSARLAWDPARDVQREIRDFCEGFYGPGGRFVCEYLEWYSDYIRRHGFEMDGGWGDAERWRKWVTPEAMARSDALFQQALAATQDQPLYLRHVRQAYLEVLWGGAMIALKPKSSLMDRELAVLPDADAGAVREKAALFGRIMRESGYTMWSEIVPFDAAKYPH